MLKEKLNELIDSDKSSKKQVIESLLKKHCKNDKSAQLAGEEILVNGQQIIIGSNVRNVSEYDSEEDRII